MNRLRRCNWILISPNVVHLTGVVGTDETFRLLPANRVNSLLGSSLFHLLVVNYFFLFISLLIILIMRMLFVLFSQLRTLYKRLHIRQLTVFNP